mmetsp:Transcript_6749/g.18082  ORF Transcript_6749/g.18082 Transcript_6749/m.18082 type:complete len:216 (+) Transcript_6749:894-1541(+)
MASRHQACGCAGQKKSSQLPAADHAPSCCTLDQQMWGFRSQMPWCQEGLLEYKCQSRPVLPDGQQPVAACAAAAGAGAWSGDLQGQAPHRFCRCRLHLWTRHGCPLRPALACAAALAGGVLPWQPCDPSASRLPQTETLVSSPMLLVPPFLAAVFCVPPARGPVLPPWPPHPKSRLLLLRSGHGNEAAAVPGLSASGPPPSPLPSAALLASPNRA